MCEWGTEEQIEVTIAAHLSSDGTTKRKTVGIDACIAPLVRALDAAGVVMTASCCGHGRATGRIDLADGRVLTIRQSEDVTCEHGTAMDVHCCNCHSGFIFDTNHECPPPMLSETATCELCGEPMPSGEEMFKFHGYSGPCPGPALPKSPATSLELRIERICDALGLPAGSNERANAAYRLNQGGWE